MHHSSKGERGDGHDDKSVSVTVNDGDGGLVDRPDCDAPEPDRSAVKGVK